MADSSVVIRKAAVLKQCKLQGQMDWTIENFASWSNLLDIDLHHSSPDFEFKFPGFDKTFTFSFLCCIRDEDDDRDQEVEFYLENKGDESVAASVTLSVAGDSINFSRRIYPDELDDIDWQTFSRKSIIERLPPDGNLLVRCSFTILVSVDAGTPELVPAISTADEGHCQSMQKLFREEKFSDVDVVCGHKTFKAHKCILSNKSDVFEAVFNSKKWLEGAENKYHIRGFDPDVVEHMLNFLYTGRMPEGAKCSPELLLMADQYNLTHLVALCEVKLSKNLTAENVLQVLHVADKIAETERLKSAAVKFVSLHLPEVIHTEAWEMLVASRRDLLSDILKALA